MPAEANLELGRPVARVDILSLENKIFSILEKADDVPYPPATYPAPITVGGTSLKFPNPPKDPRPLIVSGTILVYFPC
jgi:hypothetical protein